MSLLDEVSCRLYEIWDGMVSPIYHFLVTFSLVQDLKRIAKEAKVVKTTRIMMAVACCGGVGM